MPVEAKVIDGQGTQTKIAHPWSAAVHGLLFLGLLAAVAMGAVPPVWPWYLVAPLLVYAAILITIPALRQTAPTLSVGRLGWAPLAYSAALCVIASTVLITFHIFARPDVTELGARVPGEAFGNVMLAGVVFSIVIAVLEEFAFRGILWEAVAKEWNAGVALVATSVLFGLGHLDGYPPGPLGAVLAGLYGLGLGLFRGWVGGLGLPIACHVCADATIFGILHGSGSFER